MTSPFDWRTVEVTTGPPCAACTTLVGTLFGSTSIFEMDDAIRRAFLADAERAQETREVRLCEEHTAKWNKGIEAMYP